MKRDLRGLGSLSKPAGLAAYKTTVGIPQASAARSLGGVTGLAPEGECSTESTGNLIHLCWEGLPRAGHRTCCLPHGLLLLPQAELGRSSRRRSSPCSHARCQPHPLEQEPGALLYGFPSSPCPSLTLPPPSAKRPGLLVPRRRWR